MRAYMSGLRSIGDGREPGRVLDVREARQRARAREVEVEPGVRQCPARVDELRRADLAQVALAARDVERGLRGGDAPVRGIERRLGDAELLERGLHLQADGEH